MLKHLTLITALSLCWSVFANTNDDINAIRAEGVIQTSLVPRATIETLKKNSAYNQSQSFLDEFMQHARASQPAKKQIQAANGAILFVSFSMPEQLLFSLADEAAQFDIPVVMNGLVDGDFKKTIEMFARLNNEAKKQHLNFKGISIDPIWFQQFQIKSVPALVVTTRPANCTRQTVCASQTFDLVYGNASIKKGLELIAEKGDAAPKLARTILERGHV